MRRQLVWAAIYGAWWLGLGWDGGAWGRGRSLGLPGLIFDHQRWPVGCDPGTGKPVPLGLAWPEGFAKP